MTLAAPQPHRCVALLFLAAAAHWLRVRPAGPARARREAGSFGLRVLCAEVQAWDLIFPFFGLAQPRASCAYCSYAATIALPAHYCGYYIAWSRLIAEGLWGIWRWRWIMRRRPHVPTPPPPDWIPAPPQTRAAGTLGTTDSGAAVAGMGNGALMCRWAPRDASSALPARARAQAQPFSARVPRFSRCCWRARYCRFGRTTRGAWWITREGRVSRSLAGIRGKEGPGAEEGKGRSTQKAKRD